MCCSLSHFCRWHTTNRFRYVYSTPVTQVVTCLRMLPRPRRGAQQVARADLRIDPPPRAGRSWIDRFGNCVVEVEHAELPTHLEVVAELCIAAATAGVEALAETTAGRDGAWDETGSFLPGAKPTGSRGCDGATGRPDNDGRDGTQKVAPSRPVAPSPCLPVSPSEAEVTEAQALFLQPTRLVDRAPEINALAFRLRRCESDEELAWECMHQVYREMRYLPGSTGVATTASAAFAQRTGVCQDFAQVMLALCRAARVPARYVSGHLEGEGHMHAWVEVLYAPAAGGPPAWHALDPTHDCAASGSYVTIAVGRDYADVSPISGRCYGPRPGHLSSHQQTRRCLPEVPATDAGASRM
jgi:transglutaminase-like putative cysteine protease